MYSEQIVSAKPSSVLVLQSQWSPTSTEPLNQLPIDNKSFECRTAQEKCLGLQLQGVHQVFHSKPPWARTSNASHRRKAPRDFGRFRDSEGKSLRENTDFKQLLHVSCKSQEKKSSRLKVTFYNENEKAHGETNTAWRSHAGDTSCSCPNYCTFAKSVARDSSRPKNKHEFKKAGRIQFVASLLVDRNSAWTKSRMKYSLCPPDCKRARVQSLHS